MSLSLKKLAVAAAIVVSMGGLFAKSAEAIGIGTFSGLSNLKQEDQQVNASFDIDTEKSFEDAVENVSLTNSKTDTTFFTSAVGSIGQRTLLSTTSDVDGFLNNLGLDSFNITRDDVFDRIPGGEEPIAAYVMNLTNDLTPNDEATLTLFFDESKASFPRENGLRNLTTSTEGVVSYVGTETVPGVLIRNYRDGLDDPNGNVINGRVIDKYGVGPNAGRSAPFSVRVPESSTSNSLLVVGAFGGLLMLKRNQRVNKFQASIKN
jgi:hypothetical protein